MLSSTIKQTIKYTLWKFIGQCIIGLIALNRKSSSGESACNVRSFAAMWTDEKLFFIEVAAKVNKSSLKIGFQCAPIVFVDNFSNVSKTLFSPILLVAQVYKKKELTSTSSKTIATKKNKKMQQFDCPKNIARSSKKRVENVDHNYVKGVARLFRVVDLIAFSCVYELTFADKFPESLRSSFFFALQDLRERPLPLIVN